MTVSSDEQNLRQQLAAISRTRPEDWFLVSRARHGMEAVLKTIADERGAGEVVTQPFTCITAINPIMSAGHTPRYGDIEPSTLTIDPRQAAELTNSQTRAVMVQHTFGKTAPLAAVKKAVRPKNPEVLVLEDAAHCLGIMAGDKKGPIADISFHSFGAEKLLPSRFGGAVWVSPRMANAALRQAITRDLDGLPRMSALSSFQTATYRPLNGLFNRLPAFISAPLRRFGQTARLFITPIMPIERRAVNFGRPERLSRRVTRSLLANMKQYEAVIQHRTRLAELYIEGLKTTKSIEIPAAVRSNAVPYVRFPLILATAETADELFERLNQKGMQPGKWYRPLFFPGADDQKTYSYIGECDVAEDISARIINLPTGLHISPARAKEIIDEINR